MTSPVSDAMERCARLAEQIGQCANADGSDPQAERLAEDIAAEIRAMKAKEEASPADHAVSYCPNCGEVVTAKEHHCSEDNQSPADTPGWFQDEVERDLSELYCRLNEGVFYKDYDEDGRLMGVLRQHIAALSAIKSQQSTVDEELRAALLRTRNALVLVGKDSPCRTEAVSAADALLSDYPPFIAMKKEGDKLRDEWGLSAIRNGDEGMGDE